MFGDLPVLNQANMEPQISQKVSFKVQFMYRIHVSLGKGAAFACLTFLRG